MFRIEVDENAAGIDMVGREQVVDQVMQVLAEVDLGQVVRAVELLMDEGDGANAVLAVAKNLVDGFSPAWSACRVSKPETICRLFLTRWWISCSRTSFSFGERGPAPPRPACFTNVVIDGYGSGRTTLSVSQHRDRAQYRESACRRGFCRTVPPDQTPSRPSFSMTSSRLW